MRYNSILLAICCLLIISSCKTNKDLIYLHKAKNNHLVSDALKVAPVYHVKINDNLFVDIQSLSPLVNAMYNPTKGEGSQTGTSQNYGSVVAQFINGYQVSLNGDIALPLLGDIPVLGLSLEQVRGAVQQRADKFIKDATVRVKLLSFKVTVLGEVRSPGVFYNFNSSLSILEAISMAKGVTDYARVKKVLVVRQSSGGSKTFRLDLTEKDFLSSEAFFLLPNDVVYIEPDRYKNIKINTTFYSLLLSSVSTLILILNVLK